MNLDALARALRHLFGLDKAAADRPDPVDSHIRWSNDIKETQGHAPNYPLIGDTDLKIAKLYGMLPATLEGTSEGTSANR